MGNICTKRWSLWYESICPLMRLRGGLKSRRRRSGYVALRMLLRCMRGNLTKWNRGRVICSTLNLSENPISAHL
jgi:hypothetical protein